MRKARTAAKANGRRSSPFAGLNARPAPKSGGFEFDPSTDE
jgi:hypothetical protein